MLLHRSVGHEIEHRQPEYDDEVADTDADATPADQKPEEVEPEPESETEPDSNPESVSGERDPMFNDAARVIVSHQQGSASLLQRKLKLGYNRAGRIIDQMEEAGIVGPFEGSKARQVFVSDLNSLEDILN